MEFWGWSFSRSSRSSGDWKLGDFEARDLASPNPKVIGFNLAPVAMPPQSPSISACQRPHLWSQVLPSATMLYWAYLIALKPDAVSAVSSCSQYLASMSLCTWYSNRTSSSRKTDTKLSIYCHFHSLLSWLLTFEACKHSGCIGFQALWVSIDHRKWLMSPFLVCVCVWKNSVANVACGLS